MSFKHSFHIWKLNILNLRFCPKCGGEMYITDTTNNDTLAFFECKKCHSILQTKEFNK